MGPSFKKTRIDWNVTKTGYRFVKSDYNFTPIHDHRTLMRDVSQRAQERQNACWYIDSSRSRNLRKSQLSISKYSIHFQCIQTHSSSTPLRFRLTYVRPLPKVSTYRDIQKKTQITAKPLCAIFPLRGLSIIIQIHTKKTKIQNVWRYLC